MFDAENVDGIGQHRVRRVIVQVKLAVRKSSVNEVQSLRATANALRDVAVYKDVSRFAPHDNALRHSRVSTSNPKHLFDGD